MNLGGLEVTDLGADDALYGAYEDGSGNGLGFSIGGLLKGVAKVATAPARLAFKGAKAAGKGVVAGAKFVGKHPYLLAPAALAIPGAPALVAGIATTAAKGAAKVATSPFKLAGKVLGIGQPKIAPTQRETQAQVVAAETERLRGERQARDALRRMRPQIAPESPDVAAIVGDATKTRDQKRSALTDLLKQIAGQVLTRDATGASLPEGLPQTPTINTPSGAPAITGGGNVAPQAADETAQAPTFAGMFQGGPMPLLLMGGGLLALTFFAKGGGGGRRRNPRRRARRR